MTQIHFPMNFNNCFVLGGKNEQPHAPHKAQLHATAASFLILHSVHFCEAIATQFLQCCQKLKNYISLQFHIDWFTKR